MDLLALTIKIPLMIELVWHLVQAIHIAWLLFGSLVS